MTKTRDASRNASRDASGQDGSFAHAGEGAGLGFERDDWAEPEETPRDWKKLVLVVGLGALSWVATYVGMLELIEANMGELPLIHKVIIGFSVAMLMTMIIWLLDQMFAPDRLCNQARLRRRLRVPDADLGRLRFRLLLEGAGKPIGEAARSARSPPSARCRTSLHAGSTRLEQLQVTLDAAHRAFDQQGRSRSATKGTSLPQLQPGRWSAPQAARRRRRALHVRLRLRRGPRRTVKSELDGARRRSRQDHVATMPATVDAGDGTRNEFMRGLSRRLDMTVTGFNAFRTDPQLAPDPRRSGRPRREDDFPDVQRRHVFLPRSAVAGRLARRRARHRPAARAGASRRSPPSKARKRPSRRSAD